MKRKFLPLLLVCLTFGFLESVHAIDPNSNYVLGIHVDPMLSWFSSDNNKYSGSAASIGMNAGLEFEYRFARRYSLLSGASIDLRGASLAYKQDGYKLNTRYDGKIDIEAGKTIDTRIRAVSIPMAVNMRAIEIGYTTFFATAGLLVSIPFYEEAKLDGTTRRTSGMYSPLFINYMLRLGAEYSLGGSSSIQAGLVFDGSFLNMYRTGHGSTDMYSLGLRIGFVF